MSKTSSTYRATMFDGEAGLDWLRPGWRGLRLYGKRAKAAIQAGDVALKADMISRADRLLTVMSGIVESGTGNQFGQVIVRIYEVLRITLLKASIEDDCAALDDYDDALRIMDQEFLKLSESTVDHR